jgi:hypothetical protein
MSAIRAIPIVVLLILSSAPAPCEEKPPPSKAHPQDFNRSPRTWGALSGSARYRYEVYARAGPLFPYDSLASTARLTAKYESPSFRGWSVVAEPEAVVPLGSADYSVPALVSQNKAGHPPILDPLGLALNQGFVRWHRREGGTGFELRVGRQELVLNDGRFVSTQPWRQHHQSFDAISGIISVGSLTLRYAFANHFNRVIGRDAANGRPAMATHLADLAWKADEKMNISIYGLFLDYHTAPLRSLSTQTLGVRISGPYRLNTNWGLLYAGEIARQKDFGTNLNRVGATYALAEFGVEYNGRGFKLGHSLVGGRSATDKLSNPLGQAQNGWTELFFANPGVGSSQGLKARYIDASGSTGVKNVGFSTTLYDYRSDAVPIHYGREFDAGLKYKAPRARNKWEVGFRLGWYWADRLFTDSLRCSIYTSLSL